MWAVIPAGRALARIRPVGLSGLGTPQERLSEKVAFTAPPDAPPKGKRQSRPSRGRRKLFNYQEKLERAKGFEPSTPTLASLGILLTFINDAERFSVG
jgi:hypothetical protein